MQKLVKLGRRWLYIVHRWVGIAAALLFAMWFCSGLVMMYVPFPALTERERLAGLDAIDWSEVKITPGQALAKAGLTAWPGRFRLEMLDGAPVYRISGKPPLTLSAVDGRRIDAVPADRALHIARQFAGWSGVASLRRIERDQWTVAGGYNASRPLYRIALHDPAGTTLYVSSRSGEVVLDTSRVERAWNWVGAVPHWIYFTNLRKDQPLWRQVILWTSGVGIVGAATGVWVGLLRLRLKRRYAQGKVSPYRGWMKWHHVGGLVTGLTVTTWIVSGWLSVNPNDWFARSSPDPQWLTRFAGQAAAVFPFEPAATVLPKAAKEARFLWVAGRPEVVLSDGHGARTVLDGASGRPVALDQAGLFANAAALLPGVRVVLRQRLDQEDLYWYGHHAEQRLPVLRVGFADKDNVWFHIDPLTGEVLGTSNRSDRTERWAFNFLHDFDLPVLLHSRPTWDILVWSLSIGGLVTSITSVVIGWRRLKRKHEEIQAWRRRRARLRLAAGH